MWLYIGLLTLGAITVEVTDFRVEVTHIKARQWTVQPVDAPAEGTSEPSTQLIVASLGLDRAKAADVAVAADGEVASSSSEASAAVDAVHAGDIVASADGLAIETTHFADALAGCSRSRVDAAAKVLCDAARASTAHFLELLLDAGKPLLFPLRRTHQVCGPNGDEVCSAEAVAAATVPGQPYEIDAFVRVEVVHPKRLSMLPSTPERTAAVAEHRAGVKLAKERAARALAIAELKAASELATAFHQFVSTYPPRVPMGLHFIPNKSPCTIQVVVHPVVMGDELVSVNGIDVMEMTPTELVQVLASKAVYGKPRTLAWRRRKPKPKQPYYGRLQVLNPSVVARCYVMRKALFGAQIPECGEYALAVSDPLHACDPVRRDRVEGKVVLVMRGQCTYKEKLINLENAGAAAGIVINVGSGGGDLMRMPHIAGGVQNVTIPAMMIGAIDGTLLKTVVEMAAGLTKKTKGGFMVAEGDDDDDANADGAPGDGGADGGRTGEVTVRLGDQGICGYAASREDNVDGEDAAAAGTEEGAAAAAAAKRESDVLDGDIACPGGFPTEGSPLVEMDESGIVKSRWITQLKTGMKPVPYNPKLMALQKVPKRGEALVFATIWNGTFDVEIEGAVSSYGVLPPKRQATRLIKADPFAGCGGLRNAADVPGSIVLMVRGECQFADKSRYAQKAGAVGMMLVDAKPGNYKFRMPVGPEGAGDVSIYSMMFDGNAGVLIDEMMLEAPQIVVKFQHDL